MLNVRLFRATEGGLATLRVRAFRHVHDLSVLTQNAERRGSLVSRVTSDVDTISTFMQWGGLLLVVSVGQLVVATVLMAIYSWQLTLLVWACFLPLFLLLRTVPEAGRRRPTASVRERVGDLLGAVSESVVGAATDPGLRRRGAHRQRASTGRSSATGRQRSGRRSWSR